MISFRMLAAVAAATLMLAAAPAQTPEQVWRSTIASENQQWSQGPRALLNIQDETHLADGQSATLLGNKGDPASYRFVAGKKDGGVAVVSLRGGTVSAVFGTKTFDGAALKKGVILDTDIEILAQILPAATGQYASVLLYDHRRAATLNFKGLDYFPYDPSWRVTASFVPDRKLPPRMFHVSRGADRPYYHAGDATFAHGGKTLTIPFYALSNDPKKIQDLDAFFMDEQTGTETYGAGRYASVYDFGAFPPRTVTIDFNLAFNPLCARSAYFSCAIALDTIGTAVRAGEKAPPRAH